MARRPMLFLSPGALGFFLFIDFFYIFLNSLFNVEFVLDFLFDVFNRIWFGFYLVYK